MAYDNNESHFLYELPFYNLDRDELLKTSGAWTYSSSTTNLDSKDLFQDIIECPDNNRNLEECIYNENIESKYYNIKQTGSFFRKAKKQHAFSIMHYNMRSLPKNLSILNEIY